MTSEGHSHRPGPGRLAKHPSLSQAEIWSQVEMAIAAQVREARIALGENPGRGHSIESAVFADLRGIVVKKTLICYRLLPTHVQIVRILDVRQDSWTILKSPRTR